MTTSVRSLLALAAALALLAAAAPARAQDPIAAAVFRGGDMRGVELVSDRELAEERGAGLLDIIRLLAGYRGGDTGAAVSAEGAVPVGRNVAVPLDLGGFLASVRGEAPQINIVSYSVRTAGGVTAARALAGADPQSLSFRGAGTSIDLNASTIGGAAAAATLLRQSIR